LTNNSHVTAAPAVTVLEQTSDEISADVASNDFAGVTAELFEMTWRAIDVVALFELREAVMLAD
jgi:hypothetical protein